MATRFAWVLNLDADLELAAPLRYAPTKGVLAAMEPMVARLASTLLGPDDVLVGAFGADARGLPGRAFCPTPRALKRLTDAGALPEPHPPLEVLRAVGSRAFTSTMGATLPSAAFVTSFDAARAMLHEAPAVGKGWRIKRAFGMAGRRQRCVEARRASETDFAFVRAGLAEGGVQIEPDVPIVDEYSLHGMLAPGGACTLGELVVQRCDAHGAWLSTERIARPTELERSLAAQISGEAERVARALWGAGYFGPFGVDAFTYRDRAGAICIQPRSEVNARYTMGFATGFARARDGLP